MWSYLCTYSLILPSTKKSPISVLVLGIILWKHSYGLNSCIHQELQKCLCSKLIFRSLASSRKTMQLDHRNWVKKAILIGTFNTLLIRIDHWGLSELHQNLWRSYVLHRFLQHTLFETVLCKTHVLCRNTHACRRLPVCLHRNIDICSPDWSLKEKTFLKKAYHCGAVKLHHSALLVKDQWCACLRY